MLERVRRIRELRKALVAAEQDLVRAERLAAIGEMTVTLHHEINNPLMAAFAQVEPAARGSRRWTTEARQETLTSVRDALHRIRDIVRRIGDLREIRTKSYATGVRMVDLDDVAAQPGAIAPGPGAGAGDRRGSRPGGLAAAEACRVRGRAGRRCAPTCERLAEVESPRLVVAQGGTEAAGAHPLGGFVPPPERDYRVVALVSGRRHRCARRRCRPCARAAVRSRRSSPPTIIELTERR